MSPDADRRLALASVAVIIAVVALALGWKLGEPAVPAVDSVDVGFLRDMIDHHDQAVLMSTYVLRRDAGVDVDTESYALEIISEQRFEVGLMTAWLDDWGYGRGDPDRRAMGWMDMAPTSVDEMTGMQSASKLEALDEATGREADRRFLQMMIEHHQGGIHMGEFAQQHASDERVRTLAGRVVSVQRSEITDLRNLQRRLGLTVS